MPDDSERFIAQYSRLIHRLSWQCYWRLSARSRAVYSEEDLYQQGVLVALHARSRHDPTRTRLITYLYWALVHHYHKVVMKEARARGSVPLEVERDGVYEPLEIPVAPAQLAWERYREYTNGTIPAPVQLDKRLTSRKVGKLAHAP